MEVLAAKPWSYALMDNGNDWILTYLIGGVAEIDVSMRLNKEEIAMIQDNPNYLETLVEAARTNRATYASREIYPTVWPDARS
jgi:hypothetical protein